MPQAVRPAPAPSSRPFEIGGPAPDTTARTGARPAAALRTNRCATALALALVLKTPLVLAQPQPDVSSPGPGDTTTATTQPGSSTAAPIDWQIPAGPLADALAAFASTAGISLIATPDLLAGRRTAGLSGRWTIDAGLAQLLQGSGLTAVGRGAGAWALRAVPAPAPASGSDGATTVLPAVAVTAQPLRDATSEGTQSWSPRLSTSATRLNLTPRETPQTLSVVTRRQLDDLALTTVDEALAGLSGVHVQGNGSNGSSYLSRGFETRAQYDGMPNPVGIGESNRSPLIDSAFLDRIEVIQGAAGLLTGAGAPGGTIDLVRKQPTRQYQAHVEAQVGSWHQRRLLADLAGPLLESGRLRGRLVAFGDRMDSFVDHVYNNKTGVYAAVAADLTTTTTVNASLQWQRDSGRNQFSLYWPPAGSSLRFDRSTYISDAQARLTKSYRLLTVGLEQKLAADWQLKAVYTHGRHDVESLRGAWVGGTLDVETGTGLRLLRFNNLVRQFDSDAIDAWASGPVTLLGRRHELVVGVNGSRWGDASRNSGLDPIALDLSTFNPETLPEPAGERGPLPPSDRTTQYGLFTAARLNLADPLKLIVGARLSWYRYRDSDGVTTQKESHVVTPYAGLVYDLDAKHSVYASYTDVFNPQSARGGDGAPIKPVVGRNLELGIKGDLARGNASWSAAVFRLDQTNMATVDESVPYDETNVCQGYCYRAADRISTNGIDLSIQGELTPRWTLGAGYSWLDSHYATGEQDGERYRPFIPRHNFRLASSYHLADSAWTLGATLRAQSGTYAESSSRRLEQGSVVLAGLSARYQLSRATSVTTLVDNLFDRRYFAGIPSSSTVTWGYPRRLTLMLRHQF